MRKMIYGYVRVSTKEQCEDRQLIEMKKFRIKDQNIFIDKQSGKNFSREQYQKLLKKLGKGDLLVVKSIDRLGRNYEEILEQWRIITKLKQVDIVVLDMPLLDTRQGKDLLGTFIADIVLQLLSFVSEHERKMIHQRQAEGIEAAKQRGVKFGRPPKEKPKNFDQIVERWSQNLITTQEAIEAAGVSGMTFYRWTKN